MTLTILPIAPRDDGDNPYPGPGVDVLMRNRITRGARYLSIHYPGWLGRAQDLPKLSPLLHDSLHMNVVGSYETWAALEKRHNVNWLIYRGFMSDSGGQYGDPYSPAALSAAWRTYLAEQPYVGAGSPQAGL